MTRMRGLAVTLGGMLAGCAIAGQPNSLGNGNQGSGIHLDDSGVPAQIDAQMQAIDAGSGSGSGSGGGPKTLSETTSATDGGYGESCGVIADGYTLRNSFYRVFKLSDFGITGTFHVTNVDFSDSQSNGSPNMKVSVGTYSGTYGAPTLTPADISLTANNSVTLGDVEYPDAQSQDVAVTADVTGLLVVEIDQTNKGTASNGIEFYIGANQNGETEPGYVSSPDDPQHNCFTGIEDMSTAAMAEADPIITVTGTY